MAFESRFRWFFTKCQLQRKLPRLQTALHPLLPTHLPQAQFLHLPAQLPRQQLPVLMVRVVTMTPITMTPIMMKVITVKLITVKPMTVMMITVRATQPTACATPFCESVTRQKRTSDRCPSRRALTLMQSSFTSHGSMFDYSSTSRIGALKGRVMKSIFAEQRPQRPRRHRQQQRQRQLLQQRELQPQVRRARQQRPSLVTQLGPSTTLVL